MSGSLLLICELLSKVEVVKVSQLPQNICLKMIGWIKCESFTLETLLFSNAKCGIERNDFFIALKAEVFCRELDSISGPVGVHIDF